MLTNQTSETKMMLDRDLGYWNTFLFQCMEARVLARAAANLCELQVGVFGFVLFLVEICM